MRSGSQSSGAHMTLVPRILDGLKENGADDVLVVVGGDDAYSSELCQLVLGRFRIEPY
jgi:methylmalonyl-CoA mutase cobalamin-binding domain/chain